ncbi:hypothetical protein D187_002249 [Cystobacter fuscus DSM 2262]|uniref:Uncharacterized protein n=1 Tax=Cystobacter fuscus (strain ATCC 25194 / DSM 2262 / NBRC 100088 / M29) TaxID=1242864 RepID=S9QU57_CYSF2|nr:hypothetical protein [Cystobacter fuscus]EPX60163.1 hypothetical protein D187_002249 [Cystobacter fuscus DSM 2262]
MSEEKSKPEGKKLRRPIDDVRDELLKDPDVKEQARLLQIPVEQYVEKILDYASHPEKPPAIMIVPDEALKKEDPSIPTVAEVETHLQRMVNGEIPIIPGQSQDGFSKGPTPAQYQRTLGGEDSVPYKVPPKTDASSKELSQELELQRPKPKFKP